MPKKAKELSPLAVKRLSKPGLYAVGGVSGLQLQIKSEGAKSWILRAMVGAKRRDIGLGGYPDVGLAEAREKARQSRSVIDGGVDPIASKKAAKSALIAAQASQIILRNVQPVTSQIIGLNGKTPNTPLSGKAPLESTPSL